MSSSQMEARCPRGPEAATTVTAQGARTPNWPTQPAIQLQASCTKPPLSTHHTRARWLSGGKHKYMNE